MWRFANVRRMSFAKLLQRAPGTGAATGEGTAVAAAVPAARGYPLGGAWHRRRYRGRFWFPVGTGMSPVMDVLRTAKETPDGMDLRPALPKPFAFLFGGVIVGVFVR